MNGKSYKIPLGMVLKKHYCPKCGTKLERERTHRVVSEGDKDYYQYHRYGKFPKRDYDVYEYRFKCPSCEERISYNEQCVMERIQKRVGHFVLSSAELEENHEECKRINDKMALLKTFFASIISGIIFFAVLCLFGKNNESFNTGYAAVFALVFTILVTVQSVRIYRRNNIK